MWGFFIYLLFIFNFYVRITWMNNKILIYTDGSSRGNPGPGGWGAIVLKGHQVKELGGNDKKTTNNRMELTAVIQALKTIDTENEIKVFTDSEYLINGITKWVFGWNSKGWKTAAGGDVLNKDLWKELLEVSSNKEIEWRKVKGHAGHDANERVDDIATNFADDENIKLFSGSIKDYPVDLTQPNGDQVAMSDSERKKSKAYSYVSLVDGQVKSHSSWQSCKEAVEGKPGARFRKTISKEDQDEIIKSWGL